MNGDASLAEGGASSDSGVWRALLAKATRKPKENNATIVLLGDKRCGKSALLSKFSDRMSTESLAAASTGAGPAQLPSGVASLLASSSLPGGGGGSEHTLDYSYCAVKNRHGGLGDKDEAGPQARMHIWTMDEPNHAAIIPALLRTGQHAAIHAQGAAHASAHAAAQQQQAAPASSPASSSAAASSSSSSTSSSSSAAPLPPVVLDYATLDNTLFIVGFDLSEPWRAIESLRAWLQALERVLLPQLAALPEHQSRALKNKVSKYVQSYYAPTAESEGMDLGSPSSSGAALAAAGAAASDGAPPVDPAIPQHNLGVPLIIAGLRGDSFARHLSTNAAGGASAGSGAADEKFDFLTRKLRRLALDWGATLIYTSVANIGAAGSGAGSLSRAGKAAQAAGVNVDVLQHHVLHRLYRFPLNPAAAAAAEAAAAAAAAASAPGADPSKAGTPAFTAAAAAATAAAVSARFSPRVVGSAEDDFGIYVPAGYDSASLLATTALNGVSAALADDVPIESVIKAPHWASSAAAAAASKKSSAAAATGPGAKSRSGQFDTVHAEDNTVFFKNLKYQLEQGGGNVGGSALALAAGLSSLGSGGAGSGGVGSPSHMRSGTSMIGAMGSKLPSASPTHASAAGVLLSPSAAEKKAAAAAASGAAGGAAGAPAAGGAGTTPVKGQIAVKQFFRSLLNNTSKPADASSKAAAQQKAVRANAEKELQRMTNEAPSQQQQ